ncbi:MAG: pyruvate kinase alpha/beta domain-containing protein [Archaeoglobaceae archaeon]
MKREITYFDKKGEDDTAETLKLARERAVELRIRYAVVASTTGKTGREAVEAFKDSGIEVVVVTHQTGYKKDNVQELKEKDREFLEKHATVVTASDLLTRVPKLVAQKYGGFSPFHVIADTLRMFSQGMKVCVEVALMAADAGAVPVGEEIIAVSGTAKGADTAVVITAANVHKLFDIDIREVLAIPRRK